MLSLGQSIPSSEWVNSFSGVASTPNAVHGAESENERSGAPKTIVIIERNAFLRDCLLHSLADHWPVDVVGCGGLSELAQHSRGGLTFALLSILSLTDDEADAEFALLAVLDPSVRTMVLAKTDDLSATLAALRQGANGYISMSAEFEIFIQAMRFVAAGGTYVPPQCLLNAKPAPAETLEQASAGGFTSRELAVIQAIRQGKPNKVIAYELCMCESTVKVHVRHIMKKLHARNRTDVAIKATDMARASERAEAGKPPFVLGATPPFFGDDGTRLREVH